MLRIEKVYREFQGFTLDVGSIELDAQGIVWVHGASGCGKSSLFQSLMGFDPEALVKWSLNDQPMSALSLQEKRLGIVFQENNLFPHLTARTNLELAQQRAASDQGLLGELVTGLELEFHLDKLGSELSGGQIKRVALAQSLLGDPQVVFLDEPFVGLDEALKIKTLGVLKNWVKKYKRPVFLASHDLKLFQPWNGAEIHLKNGSLAQ